MKAILPYLLVGVLSHGVASTPKTTPIYLACTGTTPVWVSSWRQRAAGLDDSQSQTTIRLSADASQAKVAFVNLGEQIFDLKTDGESYFGSKQLDLAVLDGRISDAFISINRITGTTHIGFTVTRSPQDGGRWAFSGHCEPAVAKF